MVTTLDFKIFQQDLIIYFIHVGFVIKEYTKPITLTGLFINAYKITFRNWYFLKTFFFFNFLKNFWDPKGFWLKLLGCENNGLLFGWDG